jgi:hypothetical protein
MDVFSLRDQPDTPLPAHLRLVSMLFAPVDEDAARAYYAACSTAARLGEKVSGVMNFMGSLTTCDFKYFKVEYGPVGEQNWYFLMQSDQPVMSGAVMQRNSCTVRVGDYQLRLIVVDKTGNYPEPRVARVSTE